MKQKKIEILTDAFSVSKTNSGGTAVFVRMDSEALKEFISAFISPYFLSTRTRFFINSFKKCAFSLVINQQDVLSSEYNFEYWQILIRASGEIILIIKSTQPFSLKYSGPIKELKKEYSNEKTFFEGISRDFEMCDYNFNTSHLPAKKVVGSILFREKTNNFKIFVHDFGEKGVLIRESNLFLFYIRNDVYIHFNNVFKANNATRGFTNDVYIDFLEKSSLFCCDG